MIERFGKFHRIHQGGLAIVLPVVESIRYIQTLKEVAVPIAGQAVITQGKAFLLPLVYY